jgi:hypothetical protein
MEVVYHHMLHQVLTRPPMAQIKTRLHLVQPLFMDQESVHLA